MHFKNTLMPDLKILFGFGSMILRRPFFIFFYFWGNDECNFRLQFLRKHCSAAMQHPTPVLIAVPIDVPTPRGWPRTNIAH